MRSRIRRVLTALVSVAFLQADIAAAISGPQYDESELEVAKKCDLAIGFTVPAFDCNNGTLVSENTSGAVSPYIPKGSCDYPNHLNGECDPGSRFLVLHNDSNGYAVAHCRKKGATDGNYNDVAVIQHSTVNGATCFYQSAVGFPSTNGPSVVSHLIKAPTDPSGSNMLVKTNPSGCTSCHSNGPLIRSPYLSRIIGQNALPGVEDNSFNSDQTYRLVGNVGAETDVYKVDVPGNLCTTCHRMGSGRMSNDFAMRAVEATDVNAVNAQPWTSADFVSHHKSLDSSSSPLWMTPDSSTMSKHTETFNQAHANHAQAIKRCSDKAGGKPFLDATCSVTQYSGPPIAAFPKGTVMWLEAADARLGLLSLNPIRLYVSMADQTANHNDARSSGTMPSIGKDSYGTFLKFAPAAGTCQKMQVADSASLQLGTHDFALVVVADYNDDPTSLSYMAGKQLQSDPYRGFGMFGSITQTGAFGGQLGRDYQKVLFPGNFGEAAGVSGKPSVFVMRRVGGKLDVRVNGFTGLGSSLAVAGIDISAPGQPLEIGCRNTSTHAFTGRIYSVGVIRDTVDDATIKAFETHLLSRYHVN